MSNRLYIGGGFPNLIGGDDESDDYNSESDEGCNAIGGNIFDDIASGITKGVRMASDIIPIPGAREVGNFIADGGDAIHHALGGYNGGFYGGKGEYKELMKDEKTLINKIKEMKADYRTVMKKMPPKAKAYLYNKIDLEVKKIIADSENSFNVVKALLARISELVDHPEALKAIGQVLGMPATGINDAKGLKGYWLEVRHSIAQKYQTLMSNGASEEQLKQFLYHLIHTGVKGIYKNKETKRDIKMHAHDDKYPSLAPLVNQANQWNLFQKEEIPEAGKIKYGNSWLRYGRDAQGKLISIKTGKPLAMSTVDKIVKKQLNANAAAAAAAPTARRAVSRRTRDAPQ